MTTPPDSSSLLALHGKGRLSRAHLERLAYELASYHESGVVGYGGQVGLILGSVLLRDGHMSLRPPSLTAGTSGASTQNALRDVASVMLELAMLGESRLSHVFLATWLEQSGRFGALGDLRAELGRESSLLTRGGLPAVERARAFAQELMAPDRPRGMLITHGLSGSGKTTLATTLAGTIGAVLVRSDVEHMRSRRYPELSHALTARGHLERLEAMARQAVFAGWTVIVEGCFLSRVNREHFRAAASELGVPFAILSCSAPLSTVRERLNRRRAFGSLFHGEDASEEFVEKQLQLQLRNADPLAENEQASTLQVDTGGPVDPERLVKRLLELQVLSDEPPQAPPEHDAPVAAASWPCRRARRGCVRRLPG